jgi:hypothetical protein
MSCKDGACAPNHECDCGEVCEPNSALDIASGRLASRIASRVTKGEARSLAKFCGSRGCSQSDGIRAALRLLARSTEGEAEKTLGDICRALEIDTDSDVKTIVAAIQNLAAEGESDVPADPTAGAVALSRRSRPLPAEVAARSPAEQAEFRELLAKREAYRDRLKRMRERARGMKARK